MYLTCVVCGMSFSRKDIKDDFEYLFNQVDALGFESLTECQQTVVEGGICSQDCYEKLQENNE